MTTTAPKTSGSPLLKEEDNASYTQEVSRNGVNHDRVRGREKGCLKNINWIDFQIHFPH